MLSVPSQPGKIKVCIALYCLNFEYCCYARIAHIIIIIIIIIIMSYIVKMKLIVHVKHP